MDYFSDLKCHYKPKKGWLNDPNGLVYYKGYYHIFYQHAPDFEIPWKQPMHWGHSRTKDFINWEELPVALYPDKDYDEAGCWSGTAIVKDDVLYLFYASVKGEDRIQTVSVAYSSDGINFEKYEKNPIIDHYPADGSSDFRDPAVAYIDGKYYCVMATGYPETKKARLVIYESENLFDWTYKGIMAEWDKANCAECPSFMQTKDKFLLTASVCAIEQDHYFYVMHGTFENGVFKSELSAMFDKGPDQYAGQVFKDHLGRCILMTWIPGWKYENSFSKNVGCMSVPREIFEKDGKLYSYPVEEVRHLLKDSDETLKMTEDGFMIERTNREPVIHSGKVTDLKIIRDDYVLEVFVNGGECIYTVLL